MSAPHPCLRCGACCATFRVAFYWTEAEPRLGGQVPPALTARLDAHRLVMRGTETGTARCVALAGEPAADTRCSIYARRPSPCRSLMPAWENGEPSPQCDRARQRHGLPPLTPADWPPTAAAAAAA